MEETWAGLAKSCFRQLPPASAGFRGLPSPHKLRNSENIIQEDFYMMKKSFRSPHPPLAARRFTFLPTGGSHGLGGGGLGWVGGYSW